MTYEQQPPLAKLGGPERLPSSTPAPDPALLEALRNYLAEQDQRQQYGMGTPFTQEGPNALQGGVVAPPGPPLQQPGFGNAGIADLLRMNPEESGAAPPPFRVSEGEKQGWGSFWPEAPAAPLAAEGMQGLTPEPAPTKPKKSKSEFGDFFALLKKAKSGDENTKTKIAELAKQLNDEETSASGGTIPVV